MFYKHFNRLQLASKKNMETNADESKSLEYFPPKMTADRFLFFSFLLKFTRVSGQGSPKNLEIQILVRLWLQI